MKAVYHTTIMLLTVAISGGVVGAAVVIDDFESGVVGSSHPDPADGGSQEFSHWYDVTNDAFALTPTIATLDGSNAMRLDDGGFTNGVYAIYQAVVPADGLYTVSANIHINEDPDRLDTIDQYQIGVAVNGVHRGPNPSDLAAITGPGTAVGNYAGLTDGDDSGLATELVTTGSFSASAGDNLLIAFSTDVTSGNFDLGATFFEDGHILVDNIMLNTVPEPGSIALCLVAGFGLVAIAKRRRS